MRVDGTRGRPANGPFDLLPSQLRQDTRASPLWRQNRSLGGPFQLSVESFKRHNPFSINGLRCVQPCRAFSLKYTRSGMVRPYPLNMKSRSMRGPCCEAA